MNKSMYKKFKWSVDNKKIVKINACYLNEAKKIIVLIQKYHLIHHRVTQADFRLFNQIIILSILKLYKKLDNLKIHHPFKIMACN